MPAAIRPTTMSDQVEFAPLEPSANGDAAPAADLERLHDVTVELTVEVGRTRMMADVPTADVVVTNPTHYSVALRYDTSRADAPEVVAKGKGIIALRIRELAAEHGVPVIPDPPLARGLYASVEIGHLIPEEFFGAVAAVLAFVYRTAARRAAA